MALAYYAIQNTRIGANEYAIGELVLDADLNGRGPLLVKQGKVVADGAAGVDTSGLMAVVTHGTDGTMARPAGVGAVYWIGSATPTNAVNYDMWWSA